MSSSTETSGTMPPVANKLADLHNHQDNKPPSSGDIYGFIDLAITSPDFNTRFVLTVNGVVYALVITDRQAAITFNQNYPRQPGVGGTEPDFPEEIVDEISEMVQAGGATSEMAVAFALTKYSSGISLMKEGIGGFKKLGTNMIENQDIRTYISNNCP